MSPNGWQRRVLHAEGPNGTAGERTIEQCAVTRSTQEVSWGLRMPRSMRTKGKRRWRHYETPTGRKPVLDFIRGIPDEDAAAVLAAMAEVRDQGAAAGRHLDGDIYEVRADGNRVIYRVLFAEEGEHSQVLLALEAFQKKTQKTPPEKIKLAKRRLREWRARSRKATGEPTAGDRGARPHPDRQA